VQRTCNGSADLAGGKVAGVWGGLSESRAKRLSRWFVSILGIARNNRTIAVPAAICKGKCRRRYAEEGCKHKSFQRNVREAWRQKISGHHIVL